MDDEMSEEVESVVPLVPREPEMVMVVGDVVPPGARLSLRWLDRVRVHAPSTYSDMCGTHVGEVRVRVQSKYAYADEEIGIGRGWGEIRVTRVRRKVDRTLRVRLGTPTAVRVAWAQRVLVPPDTIVYDVPVVYCFAEQHLLFLLSGAVPVRLVPKTVQFAQRAGDRCRAVPKNGH